MRAFLIRIPAPPIPRHLHFLGHEWTAKREFHVTLLNTEMFELFGSRAIARAKKGIDFDVVLRDEFWMLAKGRARSIVQMCGVKGADAFYARLGIDAPPLHVTLFTFGDRRGIGAASEAELRERGTPVTGLLEVLRESAAR